MDTKLLRQKILDLAIHGKLVPQNPADEPASVLLERIKAEKEQLIKAGKIKKSAKLSDATHYENVPFEVPENWVWCKLDDLALYKKGPFGSSLTKSMFVVKGPNTYKVYEQKNAIQKDESLGSYYITDEKYKSLIGFAVQPNDIIVSCAGTIGETLVLSSSPRLGIINQALMIIRLFDRAIEQFYLMYFDFILKEEAYKEGKGTAIKNIPPFDILKNFYIPLPPLSEQRRIVAEIEKWFSLIDIIESSKNDLQSTIKQTKSKILDLAIHGKLVPQNPKDEPAIELLKRINPKAEINCDNALYPFEVPNNWLLMQGKSIFAPMRSTKPTANSFLYVDIDSIDNRLNTSHPKLVETHLAPSRASRYTEKGDVLFSMVRPYLRNIAMIESNNCIASTGFYVCHSNGSILPKYCLNLMLSDYVVNGLNQFMKGDNSPSINKSHIDSFIFPIPPLPEQQRIVTKIEELFAVIDNIQKSLEA